MIKLGLSQQKYPLPASILKLINFIEVKRLNPENLNQALKTEQPLSLHIQYYQGQGLAPSRRDFLSQTKLFLNSSEFEPIRSKVLFNSCHLYSATETWQSFGQGQHSVGISRPFSRAFLLKRLIKNIKGLKNQLGQLALESMDYNPYQAAKGLYEHICEPKFITQVLDQTGCDYLLDIGHVLVSAKNLGYKNVNDYLDQLPIERVVEIHLHHPIISKDLGRDKHLPVRQREINLVLGLRPRLKKLQAINLEIFQPKKIIIDQLRLIKNQLIDQF